MEGGRSLMWHQRSREREREMDAMDAVNYSTTPLYTSFQLWWSFLTNIGYLLYCARKLKKKDGGRVMQFWSLQRNSLHRKTLKNVQLFWGGRRREQKNFFF